MKIKTSLIAIFLAFAIIAQSQSYSFSTETGTYTNLEDPISLNNGITWDDPQFVIPIGFEFQFFDTTLTQLVIEDFGLGAFLVSDTLETGIIPLLVPYGADIIDRGSDSYDTQGLPNSLSPLSYKLEDIAGSRILKVEWNNVGFYGDVDEDDLSTDFVNFQLWLYEGTNDIEIHFGPSSVTQTELAFDEERGPIIGFFPAYNFDTDELIAEGIILTGDASSPDARWTTNPADFSIEGVTADGTIYKFTNVPPSLSDYTNEDLKIMITPNPSSDFISIDFDASEMIGNTISITNTNGQIVKEMVYKNEIMDISDLSAGMYFILINTTSGFASKKLIKK